MDEVTGRWFDHPYQLRSWPTAVTETIENWLEPEAELLPCEAHEVYGCVYCESVDS